MLSGELKTTQWVAELALNLRNSELPGLCFFLHSQYSKECYDLISNFALSVPQLGTLTRISNQSENGRPDFFSHCFENRYQTWSWSFMIGNRKHSSWSFPRLIMHTPANLCTRRGLFFFFKLNIWSECQNSVSYSFILTRMECLLWVITITGWIQFSGYSLSNHAVHNADLQGLEISPSSGCGTAV